MGESTLLTVGAESLLLKSTAEFGLILKMGAFFGFVAVSAFAGGGPGGSRGLLAGIQVLHNKFVH